TRRDGNGGSYAGLPSNAERNVKKAEGGVIAQETEGCGTPAGPIPHNELPEPIAQCVWPCFQGLTFQIMIDIPDQCFYGPVPAPRVLVHRRLTQEVGVSPGAFARAWDGRSSRRRGQLGFLIEQYSL